MKSIELTEEHKTKLLEMCNVLFPEQKPFCIGLNQELNKGWGYSRDFIFGKSDIFLDDGLMIHWFEFCMTHLQNEILRKASKLNKSDDLNYDFFSKLTDSWYESHPIDYLYEEFLKLKL
jgi:hypothetical protein